MSLGDHFFAIDELTRDIVGYVWDSDDGRRDVVNMACANRSLSEPALNAIWANMRTLHPLFCVLPASTWTDTEEMVATAENKERCQVLKFKIHPQEIEPDDIARFAFYARRVESFTWHYNRDVSISSLDAMIALDALHGSLLPRLRSFTWTEDDPSAVPLLLDLPGHNLRRLTMQTCMRSIAVDKLLVSLDRLPNMEAIGITLQANVVAPDIVHRLGSMAMLREVVLKDKILSRDGIDTLANLPHLTLVKFPVISDYLRLRPISAGFPALRSLTIYPDVLDEGVLQLLGAITSSQLYAISVAVSSCPTAEEVGSYFAFLADASFVHGLKTVILTHAERSIHHAHVVRKTGFTLTPQELDPLLKIPALRTLNIYSRYIALDPGFVERLAHALPHLQTLCILHNGSTATSTYLPLSALRPLAEICPNLHKLALDVTSKLDDDLGLMDGFVSHSRVVSLFVGDGKTERPPPEVAQYLLRLFPHLDKIVSGQAKDLLGLFPALEDVVDWAHVPLLNTVNWGMVRRRAINYRKSVVLDG